MRISVPHPHGSAPNGAARLQLDVRDDVSPWRIRLPGSSDEALLDPGPRSPGFLAEGYPDWLRQICSAVDTDRVLAQAIVAEVERRS